MEYYISITEVRIDRISKEEKYYRQKANQYLTQHTPTIVKYKWKRTIQSIFYSDPAASRVEAGRIVEVRINPIEYDSRDDAFDAAQRQAEADSSQPRGGPPLSITGGKIVFEKYMGSEQRPRGRVYGPNDFIPTPREEFRRYTYEVIRLQFQD
jgi:hypothetical protein